MSKKKKSKTDNKSIESAYSLSVLDKIKVSKLKNLDHLNHKKIIFKIK